MDKKEKRMLVQKTRYETISALLKRYATVDPECRCVCHSDGRHVGFEYYPKNVLVKDGNLRPPCENCGCA